LPNNEGTFTDSTSHADGTAQGDITSADAIDGIAASGVELDGVNDHIAFQNIYSRSGPTTLSAWVNMNDDTGDNGAMVIAFGREAQRHARFLISHDTANGNATSAGFYSNDLAGPPLPHARWTHLAWSWDRIQSRIYIDGMLASGPTVHLGANTEGEDGTIGATIFSYPRFLKGQFDEVRVATSAHASAFIRTEYLSQRPDSTFIKSVAPQIPKP
jgi:Concanavalin A-like lectin/glucanases superfamily